MKAFKRDSEIESLQKQLDAVKAEHHKAASEATVKQAAEIAALEAEIDKRERAEYAAQQEAAKAEQVQVRKDFDETLKAIVEVTGELRDLLAALDERRAQCLAVGYTPAQDYTGGLKAVIASVFTAWDKYTSLTGAPARPSRQREAVVQCESQLAHAEGLLTKYRGMVTDYRGDRSGRQFKSLLVILEGHVEAVKAARRNLATALADLGAESTMQDKRRQVELLETNDFETLTLAF